MKKVYVLAIGKEDLSRSLSAGFFDKLKDARETVKRYKKDYPKDGFQILEVAIRKVK